MPDDRNVNLNTNLVSFKNIETSSVPNRKNSRGDGYVPQEEEEKNEEQEKKSEFMDKSDLIRQYLDTLASQNTPIALKKQDDNNEPEPELEPEPEPEIKKRNIFKDNPIV